MGRLPERVTASSACGPSGPSDDARRSAPSGGGGSGGSGPRSGSGPVPRSRWCSWSFSRLGRSGGGWWVVGVWSDLLQDDVAADGPGFELDVVLPLLGGADALDVGADLAGHGVDVGPDRGTGRDPDAHVAAGPLGADPTAPSRADGQVAAAGRQRDVVVGGDDLEVAGAGLDHRPGVGGADLDVAGAGRDVELLDAGADRDVA